MKIIPCHAHFFEWHKWFKERNKEVKDNSRSGQVGKAGSDLIIIILNDFKSAGHEKGQCLEDYH